MVSLYIPCHVWNFGVRKLMISLEQLRMCNACGYRGWLSHGCISFYSRLWVKEARFGVSSHEEEVISKHCNMPMSSTASLVRYCITYVQGTQVNLWLLLRLFWGEKKKKKKKEKAWNISVIGAEEKSTPLVRNFLSRAQVMLAEGFSAMAQLYSLRSYQ